MSVISRVFEHESRGELVSSFNPFKIAVWGALVLFIVIAFFSSYFTVEQYQRGVVTTWGKLSYVSPTRDWD